MRHITSFSNPAIKALRGLHGRKHRRRTGLFIAEGVRIITEAMALGWAIETLVFLQGREGDAMISPLIDYAARHGADIIAVPPAVLAKISRKDNPQMIIASLHESWGDADAAFAEAEGCWVGLDRVRDPGNLGTVLRTIDAAGASGVMLIGDCCDAFSAEVIRASMGAVFNIPMIRMDEEAFIARCQGWGGRILGGALGADATDYRQADWGGGAPVLLLMGNEQSGLTAPLMAAADTLISLPMAGRSDSLNLAVATGVCLYEWRRQNPARQNPANQNPANGQK